MPKVSEKSNVGDYCSSINGHRDRENNTHVMQKSSCIELSVFLDCSMRQEFVCKEETGRSDNRRRQDHENHNINDGYQPVCLKQINSVT